MIEVLIVPPEKIFLPEIYDLPTSLEEVIKKSPRKALDGDSRPSGEIDEKKNVSGLGEEDRLGPPAASVQEVNKIDDENMKSEPGRFAFNFDLAPSLDPNLPEDYRQGFSLNTEKKENILNNIGKGYEQKEINLREYLYPDFSGLSRAKNKPTSGRTGVGRAARRGSASLDLDVYDITPWAKQVVERIQKNWTLLPAQETIVKGSVGIAVVIERDGELSSLEIVESSNVPWLDLAARKAIDLTSPFPKLPDDFPNKNLEAYFLFHYDEQ